MVGFCDKVTENQWDCIAAQLVFLIFLYQSDNQQQIRQQTTTFDYKRLING